MPLCRNCFCCCFHRVQIVDLFSANVGLMPMLMLTSTILVSMLILVLVYLSLELLSLNPAWEDLLVIRLLGLASEVL